jgi:hypothetical protein
MTMYQAITTQYFGPGNVRGARVKATAAAGSITLGWDNALNIEQNHIAAARALASKFDWKGRYHGGALPGQSGYVFVFETGDERDGFTIGAPWDVREIPVDAPWNRRTRGPRK